MFVDLAQSTRLALRLDPEAMREVLRAFRDTVTGEIARSGYVAKLMGDAVLAYFGWPQAHEDDAIRAVAVALAITEAMGRLHSPAGATLACRIGIATGMVVVGDVIGEGVAREHAVVGPTPNLAARLQEAAGPGEIMIADTTRRLLRSEFVVEAIGARLLKGHDEAVPLFRVLRWKASGVGSFAAGPAAPTPMIGRQTELSTLCRAWEQAKAGRGQTVLLTGEAGIGKSCLVRAIAERVAEEAASRVLFQCSALHSENPFWPVVQQLPSAAALVQRVIRPMQSRDIGKLRSEILTSIATQVLARRREKPALVVFEDTQWADTATLALLRHIEVANTGTLLLITSRSAPQKRLNTGSSSIHIALGRLDGRAAGAVVTAVAGNRKVAARVRKQILARSDGVPLFIEQLTEAVLEAGPADDPVTVPATLRDSLIARLDVSPAIKAVAQIASCIGRDFAEKLIMQVSDLPQTELQEGLAALLDAGLVVLTAPGAFSFKHMLVSEIAYESLLTQRRQELHRRIAEAVESVPSMAENEPETLAHHLFAAGQNERAEVYWLRARHRVAHWQDQLDALADYLEGDAAEVIPFPVRPERHRQE